MASTAGVRGCEDATMRQLIIERLDKLEARNNIGELILEAFRGAIESGEIFEGSSE
jgi:hypothetical protein